MANTQEFCSLEAESQKRRLAKRLDEIAWAVFLIMTGGLWLAPKAWIPEGTWLAGLGLIFLGLNAARRFYGLKMNGFGVVVGAALLVSGIGRVLGIAFPVWPILLIVLGAAMVLRAATKKTNEDNTVKES